MGRSGSAHRKNGHSFIVKGMSILTILQFVFYSGHVSGDGPPVGSHRLKHPPNSCPSPFKPFGCHTFGKSLKFSTSTSAATTYRQIVLGCANSFALNSFADPHPL
jgi:hypothetical protein